MRVSTFQFYQLNANNIGRKATEVTTQSSYISEGKRVLTAKDDPVAAGMLSNIQKELSLIDQYNTNIDSATASNTLTETIFKSTGELLDRVKVLYIQANSGANSADDLKSISSELQSAYDELVSMANTKDQSGNYIFAGYQNGAQPFVVDGNGNVTYQGDYGERSLKVGNNVYVETSQAGDRVFMNQPNAIGDFLPTYTTNDGGVSVRSANIVDRGTYDSVGTPADYTFSFTDTNNDDVMELTVTDGNGTTVYSTSSYTNGQTVAFNGIEVKMDGNPLPGDSLSLTPGDSVSIFDNLKNMIAWVDDGANASDPQTEVDYDQYLNQLTTSLTYMTTRRAEVGSRINTLERQQNLNDDLTLTLNESKQSLEDLDYAQAVADFEKAKLALQASQQTFTKLNGMTLFDYI